MADNIYRVDTIDEIHKVETIEEFYSSKDYINRKKREDKTYKKSGFNSCYGVAYPTYTKKLYEFLTRYNLSMQLMLTHAFCQEAGEKVYDAIIKIDDAQKLREIMYEIGMYSKVIQHNASQNAVEHFLNIINGAIYSPYLEMKYDIWDLYSDVEDWGFSRTKGEYSSFNRILASRYVRYFHYITLGMEFENEIDRLAKERKIPTNQFIKHYKKIHDEGENLREIAVKPYRLK